MVLKNIQKKSAYKNFLKVGLFVFALAVTGLVFGADEVKSIGDVAKKITDSFQDLAQLFLAIAYVAGVAFAIAAIFKFKQHKDNPTQIPLGTPIALLAIAISLIFIGYFIAPLGGTLGAKETQAGGPKGEVTIPGMKK